jgi:hypothetical protein
MGFEAIGLRHSTAKGRFNAYVGRTGMHTLVVLAERKDNPGASITNAYERYVAAVCKENDLDMGRCLFFELYADPSRRSGGFVFTGRDGIVGTAILDRVVVDLTEEKTHWLPAKELGETVWASLRDSVELTWSYPVARRRLADGQARGEDGLKAAAPQ